LRGEALLTKAGFLGIAFHCILHTLWIFLISENSFHFLGLGATSLSFTLLHISLICREFLESRLWPCTCSYSWKSSLWVKTVHPFRDAPRPHSQYKSRQNPKKSNDSRPPGIRTPERNPPCPHLDLFSLLLPGSFVVQSSSRFLFFPFVLELEQRRLLSGRTAQHKPSCLSLFGHSRRCAQPPRT